MESFIFVSIFYCIITCLAIFLCSIKIHAYCERSPDKEIVHDEYSLI